MIDVDHIEDTMTDLIKTNVDGVKTVGAYEAEYDQQQITQMLVLSPFVLVYYDSMTPDENSRLQSYETGVVEQEFAFVVGSKSFRSRREAQVGCYGILKALRTLFNGTTLTVDAQNIGIGLAGERFLDNFNGLVVYEARYRIFQM